MFKHILVSYLSILKFLMDFNFLDFTESQNGLG